MNINKEIMAGNIWSGYKGLVVAGIVITIFLVILYYIDKELWSYLYIVILSYVSADVIIRTFVRGGNGIIQLGIFENKTSKYGIALIGFTLVVIASTLLSTYISDWALNQSNVTINRYANPNITILQNTIQISANNIVPLVVLTGIIVSLLAYDVWITYLKNRRSKAQ